MCRVEIEVSNPRNDLADRNRGLGKNSGNPDPVCEKFLSPLPQFSGKSQQASFPTGAVGLMLEFSCPY